MMENTQCIPLTQEAPVGSGATAVVYKTQHPARGIAVAVKVLREEAEQGIRDVFDKERDILSNAAKVWEKGDFFSWNSSPAKEFVQMLGMGEEAKEQLSCVSLAAKPFPTLFEEYTCASIEGMTRPALVMEWLDTSKYSVLVQFDQARKKVENARQEHTKSIHSFEKKLLYLGCQLGQAVLLMKAMGKYNPDMKWDDIFWLEAEQGKRLVLLDWNGLRDLRIGKEAEQSSRDALPWEVVEPGIQRTLASFLYRLATGQILSQSFEGTLEQQVEEGLRTLPFAYSPPFQDWLKESMRGETSLEKWLMTTWIVWLFAERRLKSLQLIKLVEAEKDKKVSLHWLPWVRAYVWGESREGLEQEAWDALWKAWVEALSDRDMQDAALEIWNKMVSDYRQELWENIEAVVDKLKDKSLQALLDAVTSFQKNWRKVETKRKLLPFIGHRMLRELDDLKKRIQSVEEQPISDPMGQKVKAFLLDEVAPYQVKVELLRGALELLDKDKSGALDKKDLVIWWEVLAVLGWMDKDSAFYSAICKKWCKDITPQAVAGEGPMERFRFIKGISQAWDVSYEDADRMTSRCCNEEQLKKISEAYKKFICTEAANSQGRLEAVSSAVLFLNLNNLNTA